MRAAVVIGALFGWLLLKYILLGTVEFEESFKYGIFYHGIALMIISFGSAYLGIKNNSKTPSFIDGFKYIAKATTAYAVGAAAVIYLWHHQYMATATSNRLNQQLTDIQNQFPDEETFRAFVVENDLPATLTHSDWINRSTEQVEVLFAPGVQISLSLMAYMVVGLFISLIAGFLWTKVWFVQHPSKKVVQ